MSFLSDPFMLLLSGTALSSLLAWQWQNRQRRHEVRLGLISDMSSTVMRFAAILKLEHGRPEQAKRGSPAPLPRDVETADAEFEISRCVLGTKLEAYLVPGSPIPQRWDALGDGLRMLVGGIDAESWAIYADRLRRLLNRSDLDAPALAGLREILVTPSDTLPEWNVVLDGLLGFKLLVIRATAAERIPQFELRPF